MTTEEVFMYSRAYRLYFNTSSYDFIKYQGQIKTPPLHEQRERQFYYRLSRKLNDAQIHATFLVTHFFKPSAFITDVCTPERIDEGIALVSRAENGSRAIGQTLYDLHKTLPAAGIEDWLYGAKLEQRRADFPDCLGDVISRKIPIDIACLLFLIPRPELQYHWTQYWEDRETVENPFGVRPWIARLRKADQLINWQRQHWRSMSHKYSAAFWAHYPCAAPIDHFEPVLF